jgi:hypothetical protein
VELQEAVVHRELQVHLGQVELQVVVVHLVLQVLVELQVHLGQVELQVLVDVTSNWNTVVEVPHPFIPPMDTLLSHLTLGVELNQF